MRSIQPNRSFFRDYVKTLSHMSFMRQGLDSSINLKESSSTGMGGWVSGCESVVNEITIKLQLCPICDQLTFIFY